MRSWSATVSGSSLEDTRRGRNVRTFHIFSLFLVFCCCISCLHFLYFVFLIQQRGEREGLMWDALLVLSVYTFCIIFLLADCLLCICLTRPRAGLRPAGPRWIVGRVHFSWIHASIRACGAQLVGLVSHWTGSSGRTCSWWLFPGGYNLITGSLRL